MVAPLNWGLGHASRCIPIIRCLLNNNVKVSLAAEGRPAALLKAEFPDLPLFELPDYGISYPAKGSMTLHMLKSIPQILRGISAENRVLNRLIDEQNIDAVISDNRYGLYSSKVPCVLITHQLNIKARWGMSIINRFNTQFISKFHACWIPDYDTSQNLSGDLGKVPRQNAKYWYIGGLSRFSSRSEPISKDIEVLAVISGPEPQRTKFEEMVLTKSLNSQNKVVIVSGKTEESSRIKKGNVEWFASVDSQELQCLMQRARLVLCRSGYSSLMDLAATGSKAVFVPTPGQTEQEYLAQLHKDRGNFYFMTQSRFSWGEMLEQYDKYGGIRRGNSTDFEKTVLQFIQEVKTGC